MPNIILLTVIRIKNVAPLLCKDFNKQNYKEVISEGFSKNYWLQSLGLKKNDGSITTILMIWKKKTFI